jgi:hypothetical protein
MSEILRHADLREAAAAKTTASVSRPHGASIFSKRDSPTLKQKPAKEHVTTEVPDPADRRCHLRWLRRRHDAAPSSTNPGTAAMGQMRTLAASRCSDILRIAIG